MNRVRANGHYVPPRPFLKWVGGKGQLLPELVKRIDRLEGFGRYHEPFVGGGALFFALYRQGRLGRKRAYLSDNNSRLVETYVAVRDHVDAVIDRLEHHRARHGETYYYDVRARVPEEPIDRAARIIYLNKTCFNGLYRENSKGEFNSPFGRYKNPNICDAENLHAVSKALKKAKIEWRPFDSVVRYAEPGDLVYFDPPYHPVSKTASFTSYDQAGFGEESQRQLARVYQQLAEKRVHVLLSNSMTPFIVQLYRPFTLDSVDATRAVNSRADRDKVAVRRGFGMSRNRGERQQAIQRIACPCRFRKAVVSGESSLRYTKLVA